MRCVGAAVWWCTMTVHDDVDDDDDDDDDDDGVWSIQATPPRPHLPRPRVTTIPSHRHPSLRHQQPRSGHHHLPSGSRQSSSAQRAVQPSLTSSPLRVSAPTALRMSSPPSIDDYPGLSMSASTASLPSTSASSAGRQKKRREKSAKPKSRGGDAPLTEEVRPARTGREASSRARLTEERKEEVDVEEFEGLDELDDDYAVDGRTGRRSSHKAGERGSAAGSGRLHSPPSSSSSSSTSSTASTKASRKSRDREDSAAVVDIPEPYAAKRQWQPQPAVHTATIAADLPLLPLAELTSSLVCPALRGFCCWPSRSASGRLHCSAQLAARQRLRRGPLLIPRTTAAAPTER